MQNTQKIYETLYKMCIYLKYMNICEFDYFYMLNSNNNYDLYFKIINYKFIFILFIWLLTPTYMLKKM